jgi:hypothetical protein
VEVEKRMKYTHKQTVSFRDDRAMRNKEIRLGYEGDNLVERLEFMLPEIAQSQTATLLITGADAVKLERTDEGRYAVDLTRDMIGPDGEREAYVRIDGAGGEVWQSAPMRLITGALPDVEEEIEKIYPTAVGQMLMAMAEHSGEMAAQEERIEQEADRAERAADALNDPYVVVRTLVPEGEASAEWTVVNGKPTLTLNVPRGKPGDKGDKGDRGDRGYTPVKGVDYTDGVGIDDIAVERLINPNNRDEWKVTFKTTDGRETSYVVADGKDGRTPIKGLDYMDGAPGPGITDLTITERTDAAGKRYHQVVIMWEEALNGSIIKAGQSFNVYDGTDGEPGKSGVHYGPDEPTDPEVIVWINPEGEGEYIDDTLTQAGRAADAKVTGERIDGFEKSTFDKVIVGKTKNLLNWEKVEFGKIISSDGSLANNGLRWTTDFIPLTAENRSIVSGYLFTASNGSKSRRARTWTHMACYDANKIYINGTYSATAISTYTAVDDNIAYIRLSYNPSHVGTVETDYYLMVEYGTEVNASTADYVPYNEGTTRYVLLDDCMPEKYRPRSVVHIDAVDGIDAFCAKMKAAYINGECDVYIGKGDYIYTNAFVDAVRADGMDGVPIGNGCRYYFETGARLYCEYTGANAADIKGFFSPLSTQRAGGNFEIYNLDLVAKNVLYAVHDETNGADAFYRHVYNDCYIELDNTTLGDSGNRLSKALGGGLGKHAEIIIEGCVFKTANPLGNGNAASYHGANGSEYTDAKIVVTNCWFDGNFRTSNLTENTSAPYPRMIYAGNSSGIAVNYPAAWDVRAWNNEVRGD